MKKFKLLVMTAIVVLFSASSLYSYYRDFEVVRYVSATVKAVGWSSSELEMEVVKFDQALTALAAGLEDNEYLELRFEVLWSRVNSLLAGKENRPLREQPGVLPLLGSLSEQLRLWEDDVYELNAGDVVAIMTLREELAHFHQLTREINVENFSGDNIWRQLDVLQDTRLHSTLSLAGLLISGGLMLLLLVRENRRNRQLAYHDILTGLPNRMHFYQLIDQAMQWADRHDRALAVHMVDLDGFKAINDSLGHKVGDKVLKVVAERLQAALGEQGQVARLGGDEFVIIQRLQDPDEASPMATALWQAIVRDVAFTDGCLSPQASIGTSLYPAQAASVTELLSHADTAMYYAKHSRTFATQLYESGMDERRLRCQKLAVALQAAIEQDALTLHYQPIYSLATGEIESIEALLRWQSVEHGTVSPLEIIAVAEQHGLAHRLNEWVLHSACSQMHFWHQRGHKPLKVNVNISPSIFMDGELANTVRRVLQQTQLSAAALVLEITEDTSVWDTAGSAEILGQLRALGIEIALDDFGTGYSSFSHLRQLPLNKLKIDKSFVADMVTDVRALNLVKTIISLAHSLDMRVVAEGIEDAAQQAKLAQLGCDLGQGYWLARPMPAAAMSEELMAKAARNLSVLKAQ
ncbi:bifunctional diguanylate cyclase/phosphodiesterase [Oceanisphaera sp. IT1-181]|uniref:putative bifunctional diguanylate cyclase/phosphodiesterase n=1 Tax=Oceanisphaera sp. IT1-181 TaxID=3081199 RepID=UPI0029CA7F12|nr:bifunctional diguanylate cyclase/phosphodiesterase [Oceanisphaera sp. IT1-181]